MRTIQLAENITNNSWLDEFIERLQKQDVSPLTIRGYIYDVKNFYSWLTEYHSEKPEISKIELVDISAYRHYLIDVKNLKASSVNRKIQAVKNLFSWAKEEGLIKTNIADNVRFMKKASRYKPKALNKKELYGLLREAGRSTHGLAKRNYALIQLIVQTGLRIREAAHLKINDITINERSGFIRVRDGKGLKEREIPLNAAARRAISAYLNYRESYRPDDFLFLSKRGTSVSVRTLQEIISNLAKKANIKRIKTSAHTLRHTFAINYLKANPGKLIELATLMGHDSLDTVAIYTRPSKEALIIDLERSPANVY